MGYVLLHAGQASARNLLRRVDGLSGAVRSDSVTSRDVVIRYGNLQVADSDGWVLNPLRAVLNARTRAMMFRMLRQAGIRCPVSRGATDDTGKLTMIRRYRVPVFDGKPIGCFRADGRTVWLDQKMNRLRDTYREVGMDEDRFTARAVDWAVRATRALGLDLGLVQLGLTPRNLMTVLNIDASPALTGRLLDLYVDAIETFISENDVALDVQKDVVLGADLEFMMRNRQGKMVLASKYFRRKGPVGCDDRSIQGDGQRLPLAELRPEPDLSPLGLVENIRQTMILGDKVVKSRQVAWVAGSMPFPGFWVGGHVHFSKLPFNSRLAKALDVYLGLPAMMIEDARTARRRRPRYGFLGDIRHKDYGGFEYRTPGSFVISPEITAAILCLAHVVATHYRQLPCLTPFADAANQRSFYAADKEALAGLFHTAWEHLSHLPMYERYQSHLELIPNMVRGGLCWNEEVDIRKSWGLSSATAGSPSSGVRATRSSSGNRPALTATGNRSASQSRPYIVRQARFG